MRFERDEYTKHWLVALVSAALFVTALAWPPVPQDPLYHRFADQRAWLGIPNALDVLSNIPFAVVGLFGLAIALGFRRSRATPFLDPWERWPYAALFGGTALTAVGSSYYHLAPDNARLVWDRLPMTLCFMGLLTAVIAERIGVRAARVLFGPLMAAGASSVVYWYWTETLGRGDLRPYAVVQFGSLILVVLLLVLSPSPRSGTGYLVVGFVAYAAAKGLEALDQRIFALAHVVSGHTLKHLAAACGAACIAAMLRSRERSR